MAALSLQPVPTSLALDWQDRSGCFKWAFLRGITKEEHQQLPSPGGAEHKLAQCCTETPADEFPNLPIPLGCVSYFLESQTPFMALHLWDNHCPQVIFGTGRNVLLETEMLEVGESWLCFARTFPNIMLIFVIERENRQNSEALFEVHIIF